MTQYAVMKITERRFKKDHAYEITDRDGVHYELGGEDEWVHKSLFVYVSSAKAKHIIAKHVTQQA